MSWLIWQVMQEIESGYKYRWSFFCLPVTYFLLCDLVCNRPQTSPTWDWGTLFHKTLSNSRNSTCIIISQTQCGVPDSGIPLSLFAGASPPDPYCSFVKVVPDVPQWALLLGNSVVLCLSSVQELGVFLTGALGPLVVFGMLPMLGVPRKLLDLGVSIDRTPILAGLGLALAIGHRQWWQVREGWEEPGSGSQGWGLCRVGYSGPGIWEVGDAEGMCGGWGTDLLCQRTWLTPWRKIAFPVPCSDYETHICSF